MLCCLLLHNLQVLVCIVLHVLQSFPKASSQVSSLLGHALLHSLEQILHHLLHHGGLLPGNCKLLQLSMAMELQCWHICSASISVP